VGDRYIYSEAEEVFSLLLKPDQVEERAVGIQVDEEVDIALGCLLFASDGPKHAKVADPVPTGGREESVS